MHTPNNNAKGTKYRHPLVHIKPKDFLAVETHNPCPKCHKPNHPTHARWCAGYDDRKAVKVTRTDTASMLCVACHLTRVEKPGETCEGCIKRKEKQDTRLADFIASKEKGEDA